MAARSCLVVRHVNFEGLGLLCNLLRECEPILKELKEDHNVSVVVYQFADDVTDFDPAGKLKRVTVYPRT